MSDADLANLRATVLKEVGSSLAETHASIEEVVQRVVSKNPQFRPVEARIAVLTLVSSGEFKLDDQWKVLVR